MFSAQKYFLSPLTANCLYCNTFRCKELLLQAINKQYPYYNKPVHVQEYYLHNLLTMLAYQPSLKEDILHLIFSKLVSIFIKIDWVRVLGVLD